MNKAVSFVVGMVAGAAALAAAAWLSDKVSRNNEQDDEDDFTPEPELTSDDTSESAPACTASCPLATVLESDGIFDSITASNEDSPQDVLTETDAEGTALAEDNPLAAPA